MWRKPYLAAGVRIGSCHLFPPFEQRPTPASRNGARLRKPGVIFRHGGACPRRAMFATRTPPNDVATPPRSSPPWSDVPGKTHWKHRSTRTSRMVARGRPMPHSGCEHSSTEASSVVGGASLSQRKSLSKPLTSYHSTQGRRGRKCVSSDMLHRSRRTKWRCVTTWPSRRTAGWTDSVRPSWP